MSAFIRVKKIFLEKYEKKMMEILLIGKMKE